MTFLSAKICQNVPSENVRDYFSLVAKLLVYVLVKNSIVVWICRTEILKKCDSPQYIFHRRLSMGAGVDDDFALGGFDRQIQQ